MNQQTLYIRNMVCPRCIRAVQAVFASLGFRSTTVSLGRVVIIDGTISESQRQELATRLEQEGFVLLSDPHEQLIESLKAAVIEWVYCPEGAQRDRLSDFLTQRFCKEYSALSKAFTESVGITIEKYCIRQKIEKIKDLLLSGDRTVSEIADSLHYSSVAALSAQFRKETGYSPSQFKQLECPPRKMLYDV